MQTQKDHVQGYAFQAGRMSAALLTGEAAYLESPARRSKTGIAVGIALSALVLVGFFLFGLIKHQTQKPQSLPVATAAASPAPASQVAMQGRG